MVGEEVAAAVAKDVAVEAESGDEEVLQRRRELQSAAVGAFQASQAFLVAELEVEGVVDLLLLLLPQRRDP